MKVRFPKLLFTRPELWYHGLMMPVLFPAGNYLFLHDRYFTDPAVFGWGTLLVAGLYGLSLVVLTAMVKIIFQRYPGVRQVGQRNVLALLAVTTLTVGLAVFDVWTYSLFPVFQRPFDWGTRPGHRGAGRCVRCAAVFCAGYSVHLRPLAGKSDGEGTVETGRAPTGFRCAQATN